MGYTGTSVPIPFGQLGLLTDSSQSEIPPNAAIKANNVSLNEGRLQKSPGSARYTSTALDASIVALHDYWPTASAQRLIAVTSNGKIWKDTGGGTWSTSTPIYNPGSISYSTDTCLVTGGAESAGSDKHLFIFSGNYQVRELTGDGSSTNAIANPAADWASAYPKFGIIYQSRLCAFGNSNRPHSLYISTAADHEDFATTTSGITGGDAGFYSIFAGEGDSLVSAVVYNGLLLLFKKPRGVYVFDWRDTTAAPQIYRLSDSFGIASPHSIATNLSDVLALSNTNSIVSLQASDKLGSIEQGDLLKITKTRRYIRDEMNLTGTSSSHAVFYPDRQQALFTMRAKGTSEQNRIYVLDMADESPRPTIETKDSPVCLTTRRDSNGVLRPVYGTDDGYVYIMDNATRSVAGTAYTGEFQTPYIDFSFLDAGLANKNKLFDFLQISYVATGSTPIYVDTYIDSNFVETITFSQVYGSGLGSFQLDVTRLGEPVARKQTKPLHGAGKAMSFRFYNSGVSESFTIERVVVSFRVSGEQQKNSRE